MAFKWVTKEEARTIGLAIGSVTSPLFLMGMARLTLPEGVDEIIKQNWATAVSGAVGGWTGLWVAVFPAFAGGREQSDAIQARNAAIATVATAPEDIERHDLVAQINGAKS